jgi:hypothetical protein
MPMFLRVAAEVLAVMGVANNCSGKFRYYDDIVSVSSSE